MPPSTTKNKTLQERKKQMPNRNFLLTFSQFHKLRGIIRPGKFTRIPTKKLRKINQSKTYQNEVWK